MIALWTVIENSNTRLLEFLLSEPTHTRFAVCLSSAQMFVVHVSTVVTAAELVEE
jgi:hypothetical protein